jgi:hypothetical protein
METNKNGRDPEDQDYAFFQIPSPNLKKLKDNGIDFVDLREDDVREGHPIDKTIRINKSTLAEREGIEVILGLAEAKRLDLDDKKELKAA